MRYVTLVVLLLLTSSCEIIGPSEPGRQIPSLVGTAWRLVFLQDVDGAVYTLPEDEVYILRFDSGGRLNGQLDCNGFGGTYEAAGRLLSLHIQGMTYAHCGDSLDDEVSAAVGRVQSHLVESGRLVLTYRRQGRLVLTPDVL